MDYVDALIVARRNGIVSDHIHLGLVGGADNAATLSSAQDAMALRHLDALGTCDGQTIVDVGCGFGGTLRILDGRLSNAQLVGVNIDKRQIAVAQQHRWANDVTWLECDAAAFSDAGHGWTDRILSLEAMFHFPDLAGFFAAAARALRPRGRMVTSTVLLPAVNALAASVDVVCQGFGPWPHRETTLESLAATAAAAGLRVTAQDDLGPQCCAGFDWMCPPCPSDITQNPVTELRRLFELGAASYPLLMLEPAH